MAPRIPTLLAALLVLGSAGITSARAEVMKFSTDLSGQNESPPNGSKASGHADVTYDTDTRKLDWTVEYKDLTGDAIGGHLHGPAPAGTNAGIMVPFKTLPSPIKGSATLNPDQVKALMEGTLYVNIHTAMHPGGELRGQLRKE